ncbi:hypothetical protein PIIN_07852 [Serendipita indica DSM 11827]|uniref:Uncharacterized protein n=1 Tax=Serendipita indica (strain DSM 11827) TaxID=1109443 RepID=G4TRF6_SERID|nr:hypothetical protein PIIN_07852 [Serendipita indica DSM 11827]
MRSAFPKAHRIRVSQVSSNPVRYVTPGTWMFVLLAALTAVQQVTQFAVLLHLKSAVLRVHSASAHVPAAKLRKQPAVKSAVLVEQLAAVSALAHPLRTPVS